MNKVSLKSIIGPAFYDVHKYVKNQVYMHYWLKGGAQKGLMSNAVVIRCVKDILRGSVFEQVKWGIYMLKA